jgi:hypothetical protein
MWLTNSWKGPQFKCVYVCVTYFGALPLHTRPLCLHCKLSPTNLRRGVLSYQEHTGVQKSHSACAHQSSKTAKEMPMAPPLCLPALSFLSDPCSASGSRNKIRVGSQAPAEFMDGTLSWSRPQLPEASGSAEPMTLVYFPWVSLNFYLVSPFLVIPQTQVLPRVRPTHCKKKDLSWPTERRT